MRPKTLLIVSPDPALVEALQDSLSKLEEQGTGIILRQYPSAEQLDQVVGAERPSAVVIGLSDSETALGLIARLVSGHPETVVAAAHTSLASDLIVACHRAGAHDYVGPPFDPKLLGSLLQPRASGSSGAELGALVCVLPARGGCGGSTVALHTAAALGRQSGKRVLLVDCDLHSSGTAFRLKLKPEFTLAHALMRAADLDELWNRVTCRVAGIEILLPPGETDPMPPESIPETATLLQSARRNYQWVVCDLPPRLDTLGWDALTQAATVLLVSTPEASSLQLARRRIRKLTDSGISIKAIRLVINRSDSRSALGPKEVGQIVGLGSFYVLNNHYEAVNQAILEARILAWDSELGQQFTALARQTIGLPAVAPASEKKSRWKSLVS